MEATPSLWSIGCLGAVYFVMCYGVVTDILELLLTQCCSWYKPTVGFNFSQKVVSDGCIANVSQHIRWWISCACVCFVIIAKIFQESHVRDSSLHIWSVFYQLPQRITNTETFSFRCRLTSTVHWRSLNQICYWFIQTVVHITHLNITLGEIVNKYSSTSIKNMINWWLNFNRYVVVMTLSHNNIPAVIKSCAIF